jgi:hypothetical protein
MVTLEQEKLELLSDLEEYFLDYKDDPFLRKNSFVRKARAEEMLGRTMQILMKEKLASEVIIDFKKFLTQERPDAS